MSGGVTVSLDHVSRSFEEGRITAVSDVSLEIAAAEVVALTGPSGCGKSTLLNLIGALDRADTGSIVVGGTRLAQRDSTDYRATTVGFVFQFHDLIPTLNAAENVQVPMIGRGLSRREREARALGLLEEVGLAHRTRSRPATLSAGERQRVALARALANEPALILADEPTGALDSVSGDQVIDLLLALRARHRTTVLLVTHDEHVASRADRVLRMRDGVIRGEAPRSASA